jgi:hypothetical protein
VGGFREPAEEGVEIIPCGAGLKVGLGAELVGEMVTDGDGAKVTFS